MQRTEKKVCSNVVLDGKTAAKFVQNANQLISVIHLEQANRKVNAKSLFGVLVMEIKKGTELTITAEGVDSEKAVLSLQNFLTGISN